MAKQTASTPSDNNDPSRPRVARPVAGAAGRAGARTTRAAATGDESRSGVSITHFVQESRAELRKVTWPTRQEATNLTMAVIAMTVGIAAFLGIIDTVLDYLVKPVIGG